MLWLALTATFAGDPDPQRLEAELAVFEEQFRSARYPFAFEPRELETLKKGKVVKRRTRLEGADRVLGAVWVDASRDHTWVAVQDDEHWDAVKGFYEEVLSGDLHHPKVAFQHLDLPWPFLNRQYTILIENNDALRESTGIWERTWDLSDVRGATREEEGAIWVDVNDGGWVFAEVAGGTLLVYHVRTVIGGNIPDEAATRYAYATLGGLLRDAKEKAESMTTHYDASHDPIIRPDGTVVPPAAP